MSNQVTGLSMGQKFKKTPAGEIPVDWEAKTLGDLADIRYGLGQPPATDQNGVPMIRATNIKQDRIVDNDILRVSREALPLNRKPFLKEGDIIVVRSGVNTGDVALITKVWAGAVAGYDLVLSPSSKIDSTYCFEFLISNKAQAYFLSQSGRSAQPHLNAQQLSALPISLPSLAEQKKIADILSTVDKVLEQTNTIIKKSKECKKGLMQGLLVHGIGHKKFKTTPVGTIPVDWNAGNIRSLTTAMINGGTPDTTIKEYWNGNIPWITGADFSNQKVAAIRRYITEEAIKNSSTNVVPKGAVLVVTRTGVGKLAVADRDIAISQDITGIVLDTNTILPEFLFWELALFAPRLKAAHQGTSINGILRRDLEEFMIPLPPLAEQKKIVEILSAVDNILSEEQQYIEHLENTKKGLMNVLLMGKVRC